MVTRKLSAEERRARARLAAAIAPNRTTGVYGLSEEGLARQKAEAEFKELQREEFEANEAKKKSEPYYQVLHDTYSLPIDELMRRKVYASSTMMDPVFCTTELPLIEVGKQDFQKCMENFNSLIDMLETQNIALSQAGAQKVLIYLGVNGDAYTTLSDGRQYQPDGMQMTTWVRAVKRLKYLDVFSPDEYAELLAAPPAAVQADPPADDLFAQAHSGFMSMFRDTWEAWLKSLRENFGLELTLAQKEKALELLERLGCTPDSWDKVRIALSKASVIPYSLTPDEILAERYESGKMTQAEFIREANAIRYGTSIQHMPPEPNN